ncbi:unnamed protein product [Clavelina lepadiformis]|uniref:Uncharacterized protein n=1 Tax=Clavelina lepadiformis TaxID=159417 RepID=A0ABP0EV79_CLALP
MECHPSDKHVEIILKESVSEIEEKPVFDGEVVDSENPNKRNLQEKYNKLATKFPDKNITNREMNTRELGHSEIAFVSPHIGAIKEESMGDREVSRFESDDKITLATLYFIMECHPSDKHVEIILKESVSEIEEKPVFDGKVVVSENLNKRNLQEKSNKLATKFPDKNITNREMNTREEAHSEIAFVSPHIGAIKEESMGYREVSRIESDDKISLMLNNIFTRQRMKQIPHIWTNLLILKT